MTTEIGFGITGCGMIGKVQAEAIASIPGARLMAVCARDEKRVAEFTAKFGATGYTDYEKFLGHPGLRIINICTPNGLHAEQGVTAERAGLKVLVEKPIDTTLEKADALLEACERKGVKLDMIFQML